MTGMLRKPGDGSDTKKATSRKDVITTSDTRRMSGFRNFSLGCWVGSLHERQKRPRALSTQIRVPLGSLSL